MITQENFFSIMSDSYSSLIDRQESYVCEEKKSYSVIKERHLQAIWLEQKYFSNLKTHCGKDVAIISPGIWNTEAGPDFLKARIAINGEIFTGDIEIHLSQEGWHQHQHHYDKRYDSVILHIILWQPQAEKKIETSSGRNIPQVALQSFLTIPLEKIIQVIDLDLYPYKECIGTGKCAHAVFQSLPEADAVNFFKAAAYYRLQEKAQRLQQYCNKESVQMLYGFVQTLGYKRNALAFLCLLEYLKNFADSHAEEQLIALGLQAFGFFENNYQKKWLNSTQYAHYVALLPSLTMQCYPSIKLELNQIRPYNHPIRRLVYLVKLLLDKNADMMLSRLFMVWQETTKQTPLSMRKTNALWNDLISSLPVYEDPYWSFHYLFEEQRQNEPLSLIGSQLKYEIIINVFFPLLVNKLLEDPYRNEAELRFFFGFYGHLPSANSAKASYLIHRFYGDNPKGQLLKRADTEQGAFQLHRDFCQHYEASCEGCPFISRFKSMQQM